MAAPESDSHGGPTLNATLEEVARAIFANATPPNPKLRKEEDKDEDWEEEC